ncbi:MAG: hypothetical protein LUC30_10395, partial [Clostridiales bacterium]|nr:hypothetical protein [Clostridiales bacterium]
VCFICLLCGFSFSYLFGFLLFLLFFPVHFIIDASCKKKKIELDKYKKSYGTANDNKKYEILSHIDDFNPYTLFDAILVFWQYIAQPMLVYLIVLSLNPALDATESASYIVCLLFLIAEFVLTWIGIKSNYYDYDVIINGFCNLDYKTEQKRRKIKDDITGSYTEYFEIRSKTKDTFINGLTIYINAKEITFSLGDENKFSHSKNDCLADLPGKTFDYNIDVLDVSITTHHIKSPANSNSSKDS